MMRGALDAAAARVRRLSSTASPAVSAPLRSRRRTRTRVAGAAATAIAAAYTTQQQQQRPLSDALLTLRLGALLGAALYDNEVASSDDSSNAASTDALDPVAVVRDALAAATQLLALVGDAGDVSSSRELQSRIAELLADAAVEAGGAGRQLRALTDRGLVDALLQFLASARPTAEPLLQKMVRAIEELVTLAAVDTGEDDGAGLSSALGISLDTLGTALGHLVDAQALRFTDLLRVGDLLCRAQQQQQAQLSVDAQQRRHFAVSRRGSAVRSGDESATSSLATGLRGFARLLSPEMPSSIKQFSLWALTSMLRVVEQLPPGAQTELAESFLGPKCAALIAALPRGNQQLQLQAAAFLDVVLHLAQQQPALAQRSAYEVWMKQIHHWTASPTSSPALQIESARCLRTLSSHPLGRQYMSESPATMEALYHLARRLHERVAQADRGEAPGSLAKTAQASRSRQSKQKRRGISTAPPVQLTVGDAIAMQRHVSRAVHNICMSLQNGEEALTSSSSPTSTSSSLLLHSKRNLPMSRVFRGAQDLTGLPVIGAEEYESSTEIGWIDILTSWSGSTLREVRANAIESLVHLAETGGSAHGETGSAAPSTATRDHILQAWLTSMLQNIRHLSGGGEILAVKQVEEIAKLSDGLTPGNEKVLFNPAVVDAGAAALAVLVENHHEELIQQGVVPLMALLSQSRHSSDSYDLKMQSTRVIANLVASSCALLSSYYDSASGAEPTLDALLLDEQTLSGRRDAWKQFVADNFDVQRMLQQTPSGKRLLRELRQWSQWEDPMRRSSYYRATQNMAAYRAFVDIGRLEKDIYCEGVHPIVPYHKPLNNLCSEIEQEQASEDSDDPTGETPMESALDVVFVHGLRGHPFGTWRTDMGKAVDGKNDIWPDVLLADDLARNHINARIITLGYEAGMVSWSSPWPSLTLQERGKVMLDALYAANIGRSKSADTPAAPVVFVTHSMGGILVKKMLLLANERATAQREKHHEGLRPEDDNLVTSTKGVVFLAVPHFGSDLAKGMRSDSVRSLIKAHPAIRDLCADPDGRLVELNDAFRNLSIDCMSIGEAKAAPLGLGLSAMVVKAESADPGIGSFHVLADSDHMTICKARSADEPHYRAILRYLVARCRGDDVTDGRTATAAA